MDYVLLILGGLYLAKCHICQNHYYEHNDADSMKCLRQANLRLTDIDLIVKRLAVLYG